MADGASADLVGLIERAIGRVIKVILRADDSSGLMGDVARDLLDLHAQACDAGRADPHKLARWMIRLNFGDQDLLLADPVRYARALGEPGLAVFRMEVRRRVEGGGAGVFAVREAERRLAVLDGDSAEIVRLYGADLQSPSRFIGITGAMLELHRHEEALAWAERGIAETSGWQVAKLYDVAAGVHARRGEPRDILRLRREQHARRPSPGGLTSAEGEPAAWQP